MAEKKFYAVRKGLQTGIFTSWDACKQQVEGYPGAEYKGFKTQAEAEEYLNGKTNMAPMQPEHTLVAYVDGSYEDSIKKYAFGCVFLMPDGRIYTQKGSGNNPESALLRNVTGEMLGAMYAVRWAIKNGFKEIELRYDYEGVEKWVTGAWKSKTELTQKYAMSMQMWQAQIQMKFTKVPAHSNVFYNEMADKLAKEGLVSTEGIPEITLKEDMEPWKESD